MFYRSLLICSLLFLFCQVASAQDFDIQRYEVNVQLQPAAVAAQVQAKLTLTNVTTQGRSGQFVNLKLNKNTKVTAVKVDGSDAQFRQKEDERLNDLSNVGIDFPKSIQPGASATVAINYSIELKESSPLSTILPGETILLPESFWVPFVHTPYVPYGPDIAPVMMTVNVDGERAQSDGARRSSSPFVFEQSIHSQPLLVSGNYDDPVEIKSGATTFEFDYPKGIGPAAPKQAEALAAECGKILDFYNQTLGVAPPAQIRIVSSPRISSYVAGTTIILGEDLFRRDSLDLETIEFLARSLLRHRLGSEVVPRGRGWNFMQDAVPTYLAGLYFEQRYGAAAGHEFFTRRSRAYAPVAAARNDGPLLFVTPLDNQYSTTMFNKGPLMLRIIEGQVGRDQLLSLIKERLNSTNKQARFEDLRAALIKTNKGLVPFFDQWFDKIVEPDFIIGIPFQAEGGWKCALRNLGEGDTLLQVEAVTEKGTKLVEKVVLPSLGRAEVLFKTDEKISTVEVDPDKFYPQTNYDNDARPPVPSAYTLFKDANALFNQRKFADAEAKLREAVRREPANTVNRAMLARTLSAENKYDEAKAEVETIQKLGPLPLYTITWMNYTMGEIALATGQRDAFEYFRRTVAASKDNVPARQKLIETERAATKLPAVDESVRSFISKLDQSIREATNQALDPLVVRANLNKFVRGIVVNKPEGWNTQILRAEQLTADKVAVDVSITAVSNEKKEQQGTALFILRRTSSGWVLSDIELFNVQ